MEDDAPGQVARRRPAVNAGGGAGGAPPAAGLLEGHLLPPPSIDVSATEEAQALLQQLLDAGAITPVYEVREDDLLQVAPQRRIGHGSVFRGTVSDAYVAAADAAARGAGYPASWYQPYAGPPIVRLQEPAAPLPPTQLYYMPLDGHPIPVGGVLQPPLTFRSSSAAYPAFSIEVRLLLLEALARFWTFPADAVKPDALSFLRRRGGLPGRQARVDRSERARRALDSIASAQQAVQRSGGRWYGFLAEDLDAVNGDPDGEALERAARHEASEAAPAAAAAAAAAAMDDAPTELEDGIGGGIGGADEAPAPRRKRGRPPLDPAERAAREELRRQIRRANARLQIRERAPAPEEQARREAEKAAMREALIRARAAARVSRQRKMAELSETDRILVMRAAAEVAAAQAAAAAAGSASASAAASAAEESDAGAAAPRKPGRPKGTYGAARLLAMAKGVEYKRPNVPRPGRKRIAPRKDVPRRKTVVAVAMGEPRVALSMPRPPAPLEQPLLQLGDDGELLASDGVPALLPAQPPRKRRKRNPPADDEAGAGAVSEVAPEELAAALEAEAAAYATGEAMQFDPETM